MTETAVNPAYARIHRGECLEVPLGAGTQKGRNRELVMPSRGTGKVFLKYKDTRFTWYTLPLGKAATRGRDEAPTPEKNVLVPVLPRVYTTPEPDPAKCAVPRAPGWLYIFKGGYLWRELEVLPQGRFRDVNLHEYAGRDVRPATVEKDDRILLPYRLDDVEQDIRMAYADVQWSWARINMLGGMDPDDFRLHPDHLPPMPEDQGYTQDVIAEQQAARLQQIDLSGFDAGFPVQPPEGRKARVENVEHANDRLIHIRLHRKANIPVVYLHDPLGIMLRNLEAYRAKEADLLAEVEKAKAHEHYRSAVLTWQTFFNEELWEKARRKHQHGSTHYVDKSDEADALRAAAREMDRELLKDILRVEPRRRLRRELRKLRQRHFDWLEGRVTPEAPNGEAAQAETIDDLAPDFITFEAALLDYASLPRDGYIQLWAVMNLALLYANHDPAALDAGLDLERDRERPDPGADPGQRYLERLCQPGHPLHAMLFPRRDQVDETSPEPPAFTARMADEPPPPDGRFRPVAFAGALAADALRKTELAMALAKEADKIVASFLLQFQRQWKAARGQAKTVIQEGLMRLVKATGHPDLRGMYLVTPGTDLEGKVIIDGELRIRARLDQSQIRERFGAAVRDPGRDRVNVIDPRTGKAVFSQAITDIVDIKGLPLPADEKAWAGLFRDVDADGVARARGRFVVVDDISPYALRYHAPHAPTAKDVGTVVEGMKAAGKVLPPLVAVVEMFNVHEMHERVSRERDAKSAVSFLLAGFAFLYVVVDTPLKVAGHEQGAKFWAEIMPRERWRKPTEKFLTSKIAIETERGRLEFRTVGTIGAGVSLAGAVMAGWDAFDSLAADDGDAAAAYGVQTLAGLALALCDLGAASTATTGLLAGLGPWGWAALAVFLAAGLVANLLKDTPVEKWGKHGPFAKDPAARGTHEYSRPVRDENGKVVFEGRGRNRHVVREPLPPEKMYEALMSLLMSPGITIRLDRATVPATILVDVLAPGFAPGRSSLNVLATGETAYRMSPQERAMAIRNGFADVAAMERFTASGVQQRLQLREWQPLLGEDGVSQIGIRYRYALPPLGGQGEYRITVRARARHVTADQLIIPTLPGEQAQKPAEPDRVDPAIPGWVYAEQPVRPA